MKKKNNEKAENYLLQPPPPPPPPFFFSILTVATHVAKTFLTLIDKHFPKDKKLSKIFDKSTIKVGYSCLPNVKQTISDNNNNRLLQLHRMKESTQDSKLCKCRKKNSCPIDGKCLTKCVVYKTIVTEKTEIKKKHKTSTSTSTSNGRSS